MTFYIDKNTINYIPLTVSELATITATSIVFLFNLVDDQTKTEYNFISENISTATSRYDLFKVIETGSTYQNLTAGTVNLGSNFNWYSYNIYEQTSTTNLIPASATTLLETGYCFVTGSTPEVTVKSHSSAITIKAHK